MICSHLLKDFAIILLILDGFGKIWVSPGRIVSEARNDVELDQSVHDLNNLDLHVFGHEWVREGLHQDFKRVLRRQVLLELLAFEARTGEGDVHAEEHNHGSELICLVDTVVESLHLDEALGLEDRNPLPNELLLCRLVSDPSHLPGHIHE